MFDESAICHEMKTLEQIGFYTLSDERAQSASAHSRLMRCELLLTDRCNFRCPYCRKRGPNGYLEIQAVKKIIDDWADDGLFAIRFSGGEPTLHPRIEEIVRHAKERGIQRIALSTNGSASPAIYQRLLEAGVNDFSVSLDACCSLDAQKMAGGVNAFQRVIGNIKMLSLRTYVTVGVVYEEGSAAKVLDIIQLAHGLGVSDIRIIPSAQFNGLAKNAESVAADALVSRPILKYRIDRIRKSLPFRGLTNSDSRRCGLVLDDMASDGEFHYPCIIYLREGGNPIGKMGPCARAERQDWMQSHDTHADSICQKNCLDVCVAYNNKYRDSHRFCLRRPK